MSKTPKKREVQHRETTETRRLFEVYYKMGAGRSLSKLSELSGTNKRTLEYYSSWFKWQDKIKIRDAEDNQALEAIIDRNNVALKDEIADWQYRHTTADDMKFKMLKLCIKLIEGALKNLESGTLEISTIRELTDIMRMTQSLYNMPETKIQIDLTAKATVEEKLKKYGDTFQEIAAEQLVNVTNETE